MPYRSSTFPPQLAYTNMIPQCFLHPADICKHDFIYLDAYVYIHIGQIDNSVLYVEKINFLVFDEGPIAPRRCRSHSAPPLGPAK
jgi:hypothetical protein